MKTPFQFFLAHAGFSYGPEETPAQGRRRCARALASAEKQARDSGMSFEWSLDGHDSTEWTDERDPATPTWQCLARDESGEIVGSLGGVDFGDGSPWSDPYRRVVEAEIALESLATV